jgi:Protein of unknown function (DUF3072)
MNADRNKRKDNPKIDPNPSGNMEKQPEDWVSGHDPMTPAQPSYLKTLLEQAGHSESFDDNPDKGRSRNTATLQRVE